MKAKHLMLLLAACVFSFAFASPGKPKPVTAPVKHPTTHTSYDLSKSTISSLKVGKNSINHTSPTKK